MRENICGGLNIGATLKNGNLTARQLRNFEHAKHAAEMSDFRVHVGAVAVLGKQILNVGFSNSKSHPLQSHYDKYRNLKPDNRITSTLHAEIHCLAPIMHHENVDWSKVVLYVYRIRKDRPHGMARPCAACMRMIRECGIKNIAYTTDDGFAFERIDEY